MSNRETTRDEARRISVGWLVDGAEDPLIKRIKKFGKLA